MRSTMAKGTMVFLLICVSAGTASAEYRCNPPPTRIDRNACQAAAEGPQALRLYVQRMRWLTTIQFSNYVNQKTLDAWEAAKRGEATELAAARSRATDGTGTQRSEHASTVSQKSAPH